MVKLALFDIIPFEDFCNKFCKIPQWKRHEHLSLLETSGLLRKLGGKIFVIPKMEVDLDTEEGQIAFDEFNREALEKNVEGIMIKDPEAPYEAKKTKSPNWLKKKPIISLTMEIIDVLPGKADGKRKDVMGAFVCRCEEDGKTIVSNVGSGFTDEQLADFWKRRDQIKGLLAEVEADKLTQEAGSDTWSLRFPRFKAFRGTVPGEKF